ncbi:MAG: L-threonylcarbamoyladenylate synthase [Patescibacteria group bacterium]|nr:L-threonylcarbamoyladenylate synthase [Patescibacteria group bacterium]
MRVLEINSKNFSSQEIDLIINELKSGSVLVFPTDTVYGLIADASDKEAVEKIFRIKRRELNKPLPVFISSLEMAKELAEVNPEQEKELKEKWPGPFSFVLKRKKYKKELFGLDNETIALRIPDYPLLQKVLTEINIPLVQTSANISGQPATGNIQEIIGQFSNQEIQPDIVFNAGNLPEAKPSTIIDLTIGKVIRE